MNNKIEIRDEEILLLGLCRLSFSAELTVMLRALAETISDWQYFYSLANSHGVASLVYNNLEKLGFLQYLPDDITGSLYNSLMVNIARNVMNTRATADVLRLLKNQRIKIVLLKGLALESMVYGNKGLRQMTDVDVLASRLDCLRAREELINNGFESLPLKSALYKPIIEYTGKHLPTLIRNGFAIELHHELFGARQNVLTKMLYETSSETDLNGEKTFVPQPQIFFLYLVKHLYLHEMNNESQLRLYTDLVVLIEKFRNQIINQNLITHAVDAGMAEVLAWRLEPLRDLWGISFPEWLNDFINKWYNPASINRFVFFLKSPKGNPPLNKPLVYRNAIRDIPGLHRKMLYVLGDIFPTVKFMKKRYHCRSSLQAIFYYPVRLGKLFLLFP